MFFPSTREKYRVVVGVRRRIGVPRRVFTSQYITHLADLHTRLIIIKCPKKNNNNKIYYIHPSEIPSSKVRRASFACHYCLFWPFFFVHRSVKQLRLRSSSIIEKLFEKIEKYYFFIKIVFKMDFPSESSLPKDSKGKFSRTHFRIRRTMEKLFDEGKHAIRKR